MHIRDIIGLMWACILDLRVPPKRCNSSSEPLCSLCPQPSCAAFSGKPNALWPAGSSPTVYFPSPRRTLVSVWSPSCSYWQELYITSLRLRSTVWIQLPDRCLKHNTTWGLDRSCCKRAPFPSTPRCRFVEIYELLVAARGCATSAVM